MPLHWFPQRHTHECQCGGVLSCTLPADRCTVAQGWACPSCEDAALMGYLGDIERKDAQRRMLANILPTNPFQKETR